jgi:hypothetical protein
VPHVTYHAAKGQRDWLRHVACLSLQHVIQMCEEQERTQSPHVSTFGQFDLSKVHEGNKSGGKLLSSKREAK